MTANCNQQIKRFSFIDFMTKFILFAELMGSGSVVDCVEGAKDVSTSIC